MASLRLFYFIEKNVVKAKNNSMWKDYLRTNRKYLDENPKIAEDLLLLFKSTAEYRRLLDLYNIGVHRDSKQQIEQVARKVGLKVVDYNKKTFN